MAEDYLKLWSLQWSRTGSALEETAQVYPPSRKALARDMHTQESPPGRFRSVVLPAAQDCN